MSATFEAGHRSQPPDLQEAEVPSPVKDDVIQQRNTYQRRSINETNGHNPNIQDFISAVHGGTQKMLLLMVSVVPHLRHKRREQLFVGRGSEGPIGRKPALVWIERFVGRGWESGVKGIDSSDYDSFSPFENAG